MTIPISIQESEPTKLYYGMMWLNIVSGVLKIYDGTKWLTVNFE